MHRKEQLYAIHFRERFVHFLIIGVKLMFVWEKLAVNSLVSPCWSKPYWVVLVHKTCWIFLVYKHKTCKVLLTGNKTSIKCQLTNYFCSSLTKKTNRFVRGNIPGSLNIPFNQAFSPEGDLVPCKAVTLIFNHKGRVVVVVGNRGKNAANVSTGSG